MRTPSHVTPYRPRRHGLAGNKQTRVDGLDVPVKRLTVETFPQFLPLRNIAIVTLKHVAIVTLRHVFVVTIRKK